MLCDSVVCGGCDAMVWSGVWCGVKGQKIWDDVGMMCGNIWCGGTKLCDSGVWRV